MGASKAKQIQAASKLFKSFNDTDPKFIDKVLLPEYEVILRIGPCTHIAYMADDGKNYIHRFKAQARPLLATSHDGKSLLLVGGKFRFTDRGIVDR